MRTGRPVERMSHRTWHRPRDATRQRRDATLAQVIEAVDRTAPATKADLAEAVGISEQYLSELLQELKRDDVVRKAYVVDDAAAFAAAENVSRFFDPTGEVASRPGSDSTHARRGSTLLDLIERLDDVTATQYEAARHAPRRWSR